jgi:pilus assembly protein Flp/PilA
MMPCYSTLENKLYIPRGKEVTLLPKFALDRAQGLVEYALILVLVVLVVFVTLLIFGPMLGNIFSGINSSLAAS